MRSLSRRSLINLSQCHNALVLPFLLAYESLPAPYDVGVSTGHRTEDEQTLMVHEGKSQLLWPNSKHNSLPSKAFDFFPYPNPWSGPESWRFAFFVGAVFQAAAEYKIVLRWGGDWDKDWKMTDHTLIDQPHIELTESPNAITLPTSLYYYDQITSYRRLWSREDRLFSEPC